jgi:Ca2+-binding RTX toxin-like protein
MATVNGTASNDKLYIGQGKSGDTLLGLAGNDSLDALAGAGGNMLRGGDGDDELFAYTNDQLFGDAGNDKLYSDGKGSNTLAGGDGNDTLYADRNDTVAGDAGDDTIFGGKGGNTITGGAGKDVFWIANVDVPTSPNTITDFDRLNDTLRINLAGVKNFSDLTIAKSGNNDVTIRFGAQQLALIKNTLTANLNSSTIVVDAKAANNLGTVTNKIIAATDPANLNLNLQDFNTKVTGDRRDNIIDASTGGGDNQIFGGDGADELYAYQTDRLFGEGGNDLLDARLGKGGNSLDGGTGDDKLFAGSNDILFGGDGDDTLFAGLGGNTLTGGNGKDTFILATGTLPTKANIITDFKAGTDTLKIFGVSGIGEDITKLTAIRQGSDTLLKAGSVELALLKNVQANSIAEILNSTTPTTLTNLITPTTPTTPSTLTTLTTPTIPIAGITFDNNLFTTNTTCKGISINAVSQKTGGKINEIGFFAVDDLTGKIGGIAPGTAGYLKLVADSAKPIFSTLHGNFFNTNKREINLDPNKIYGFFEVKDGSISDLKQQIASGKTPTNILFSFPDASGNSPFKIINNSMNDGYKVSVNSDELVLNVAKLAGATPNISIGSKSQGLTEGRIVDLTDYAGKALKVDITTKSDAGYNNNIGFYAVDNLTGTISGTTLKPGDVGYALAAVKNAISNAAFQAGKTDSKLNQDLVGGKIYAPVIVAQGSLSDFVTKNATNSGDGSVIHAYFNYLGANPDKLDHFRLLGNNTFGVEDLYGGGDRDFNDVVVNINIKTA